MQQGIREALRGFLLLVAVLCWPLQAAQDGEPGEDSSGEIFISVSIGESIQILNMTDVVLTITRDQLAGNLVISQEFCIKARAGAQFQIETSTNVGGGSAFALAGDQGDLLNYTVLYANSLSSQSLEELSPNTPSSNYRVDQFVDCNAVNNVLIQIVFQEEDILSAASVEYTGTLFITVQLV